MCLAESSHTLQSPLTALASSRVRHRGVKEEPPLESAIRPWEVPHRSGPRLATDRRRAMTCHLWSRMVVLGGLLLSGLVSAAGLPHGAGVREVEAAFPG